MEYIIKGRKPESFFRFFEEICALPHGSHNEEKVADYLVEFACARQLDVYRDVMNNVLIFLFSPLHGVALYGTRHDLLPLFGDYVITAEQLLYHLNVVLKYTCSIPIILLFVCTTNPSEFAASLNRIGVSYRISYSVALALRYIPDIQREFRDISLAQQARGNEMSKKAGILQRLKGAASILIPLVLSSIDRIETISNAMELRGFGKNKQRSWYMGRKFSKGELAAILCGILLMLISILITVLNGSRYYNPFI